MTRLIGMMLLAGLASPAAAQMHGGEPVEIPLRVEGGRLLVPVVAADGTEMEFVLTTGSPYTIFSQSTAARLHGETALTMGGIPVDVEGSQVLPDERLTSGDMVMAGLVGSKTLSQFDVLVDVPGGRLVLKPMSRSVSWEGVELSEPVRLRLFHGVIIGLDMQLNGKDYGATLDLSAPVLVVNDPVKAALHLNDEDIATAGLGASSFPDLRVSVRDLPILDRWDPDGNGFVLLGAPIAYDCAISISWVHRELRTCVR